MGGVTEVVSSSAYDPVPWASYAIAVTGAAAALAGLLIVATSINIGRIMQLPAVVSRLAATLALFAAMLFVGVVLLIPDQSRALLGIEIAVIGAALAVIVWSARGASETDPEHRRHALIMGGIGVSAAVLMAFAGIATAGMTAGGLYWLVPTTLLVFGLGLTNAWVALIEILR